MERFPAAEALSCQWSARRRALFLLCGSFPARLAAARPPRSKVWIGFRAKDYGGVGSGRRQLFGGTVRPGSPRCLPAAGI